MVKNKPATPLPWTTLEDGRSRVKLVHVETTHDNPAGAGLPVCSINRARIGDAEYLTHASNAYPEFVETLQAYARHPNNVSRESVRILLAKHGEA